MKNNKKNLKRFLAFFLSLAMIVTYVPALPHVYGAEDDQAVQEEQVELKNASTQNTEQTEESEPSEAAEEAAEAVRI